MSLFSRLSHLAANHGVKSWPSVPMERPNAVLPSSLGYGPNQMVQMGGSLKQYRDYLSRIDQWAAGAFGYDLSTPEALDQHAMDMLAISTSEYQQQQSQGQPAQPPREQPQMRRRPSATGG
jgi:hypothetical protein